jgi:hypothetical protein
MRVSTGTPGPLSSVIVGPGGTFAFMERRCITNCLLVLLRCSAIEPQDGTEPAEREPTVRLAGLVLAGLLVLVGAGRAGGSARWRTNCPAPSPTGHGALGRARHPFSFLPALGAKITGVSAGIRVTQLFDCADVAKNIVEAANSQGKHWNIIQGPWTRGGTQLAYYRFRLEQAAAYPRTQLWHVNMGGRAKWARGAFARPYALTLHGTDIRENYWQDLHHATIKADIDGAGQVWYTTPDLKEKAQAARADAEYLPVPVASHRLPPWDPAPKARVFFPSRWDASKGGDALLSTAAEIISALGASPDVELVGVDWGDRAAEAGKLGVRLLPRMPKRDFLRELATAHVAVGQVTGMLGSSELEAMGIGVPVIFADQVQGYPGDLATVSVGRSDVAQAVIEALQDPVALSGRLAGPAYVLKNHNAVDLLPRLEAGYAKVLRNAR